MEIGKLNYNFNNQINVAHTTDVGSDMPIPPEKLDEQVEDKSKDDLYKEKKYNVKELKEVVKKANKELFGNSNHLEFRIHEKTKEVMVKIVDNETKQVIKEIPPEKILNMVAKLCEMAGLIVDVKK